MPQKRRGAYTQVRLLSATLCQPGQAPHPQPPLLDAVCLIVAPSGVTQRSLNPSLSGVSTSLWFLALSFMSCLVLDKLLALSMLRSLKGKWGQ